MVLIAMRQEDAQLRGYPEHVKWRSTVRLADGVQLAQVGITLDALD